MVTRRVVCAGAHAQLRASQPRTRPQRLTVLISGQEDCRFIVSQIGHPAHCPGEKRGHVTSLRNGGRLKPANVQGYNGLGSVDIRCLFTFVIPSRPQPQARTSEESAFLSGIADPSLCSGRQNLSRFRGCQRSQVISQIGPNIYSARTLNLRQWRLWADYSETSGNS